MSATALSSAPLAHSAEVSALSEAEAGGKRSLGQSALQELRAMLCYAMISLVSCVANSHRGRSKLPS